MLLLASNTAFISFLSKKSNLTGSVRTIRKIYNEAPMESHSHETPAIYFFCRGGISPKLRTQGGSLVASSSSRSSALVYS